MKKSTFKLLFYLKRNGKKSNGNMPIIARITVNGKQCEFNTKLELKSELWNTEQGKAIGRTTQAQDVNIKLDEIRTKSHTIYHELVKNDSQVTAEKVKNDFLGISEKHETLLVLFERHNADVKTQVGQGKSAATLQKYEVTRKHLASFIKQRYHLSDIPLKEINHLFLSDFEVYLKTTGKCGNNTTAKFMQFLKRIIIIAKNNGWITADPFANYKITLKRVHRDYLTEDELLLILKKEFSIKRLEQVRDVFLFACFTGLSYIDVKNLRQDNIRKSFDGKMWIMTKRHKTDVQSHIPLLDIPSQLLKKYEDLPNGYLLPILSNQKVNSYLKEINDICGINKNLTFHMARHSFATLSLSKGVSIESVSKMLGHTNIQTTQIYARITDSKVGKDMELFADKIQNMVLTL